MFRGWGNGRLSRHQNADAKKIPGIPENLKLTHAIAFGYPRPNITPTIEGKPLPDVLVQMGRRSLDEIVHREKW
jgi:hypothetical protein